MAAASTNLLINTRPGESRRLLTALDAMMRQTAIRDDNMIPAQVISYDRVKNTAQLQPMIKVVTVTNTTMSRHSLANIPVISLGGGGYNINFPLKAGDLGWIIAADRDLSTFLEDLTESPPNSTRIHQFADSWFIPDVFRKYTIASEDSSDEAMVIQSTDSTVRISISQSSGQVKITAPTMVIVDAPQTTFTGNVTIDQNLTVTENTTITENLTVAGNATVDGTLTNNSIDVTTHHHISESPGNPTGPMIP